jgi:hypothetical protein
VRHKSRMHSTHRALATHRRHHHANRIAQR